MHPKTLAIHAAYHPDPITGSLVPPIVNSTIFEHPAEPDQTRDFNYTRAGNPNRAQLETVLAVLEQGNGCAAFSSGVAATSAVFQALRPGDHIIAPLDVYHGTRHLIKNVYGNWGLEFDFADFSDPDAVASLIKPNTKLLWVETPSNPLLLVTSIAAITKIAKANNLLVCVDNTWMTPVLQKPLELGADLVVHSTTKYLGGHSDLLGGAVIWKEDCEMAERVRDIQKSAGAVPSPFDCWMLVRSVKTLPLRMTAHCENARILANHLNEHPNVDVVHYPGLAENAGHDIMTEEAADFGAMISFQVKGDGAQAKKVTHASTIIKASTSLGGVESTWEHRKTSEGPDSTTPDNLIRLSVGLEYSGDLIADLDTALSAME